MLTQLRPGQLLYKLFKRANATGKGHESIRFFEHDLLSLMHRFGDNQVLNISQHDLAGAEKLRDDSGHMPAMLEDGSGDIAHQADASAAINKADIGLRHHTAKGLCRLRIEWIATLPRAAIDADIPDVSVHGGMWHRRPCAVKTWRAVWLLNIQPGANAAA